MSFVPLLSLQMILILIGPRPRARLGLVTNYLWGGRGYKTGGGACEVLPLRKGGADKGLAMLKGGGAQQFWGSF